MLYRWIRIYCFWHWNFTSDCCCNIDLYRASFSFEGKENKQKQLPRNVLLKSCPWNFLKSTENLPVLESVLEEITPLGNCFWINDIALLAYERYEMQNFDTTLESLVFDKYLCFEIILCNFFLLPHKAPMKLRDVSSHI